MARKVKAKTWKERRKSFLLELVLVCRRHGLSIDHYCGEALTIETWNDDSEGTLLNAYDADESVGVHEWMLGQRSIITCKNCRMSWYPDWIKDKKMCTSPPPLPEVS